MDKPELNISGDTVATADRPTLKTAKPSVSGLSVHALFCPDDGTDPFATVDWDMRTAAIKGEGGDVLFEQNDCEMPTSWSQLATNVVANKYFYGEVGSGEREKGVRQLIHRVCRTIADWGVEDGYFASKADGERFYRELVWLCLHQHAAFNSPVWFNVGLFHQYGIKGAMCNWHWDRKTGETLQPENPYEYPQASACFIQSVGDNMEDIMELARSEAMLFKFGSGTGTDLSTLRSQREKLSGGGRPSGPLSFMRVYDQIAAVVKSGGKTRRAAKMQSIKDWHPDVLEFIECKNREEKKVRTLVEQGYDPQDAYDTVLFQNANLSVRLSDDFMRAVESDQTWTTHWVTKPEIPGPAYQARDMFATLSNSAWCCGDPGVQYDTTVNRWHTCPNSGRINASNPCSEYMFVDDSACNLASINLMKFRRDDGTFDHERFVAACRLVFIAQEILVDHGSYPTKRIAINSHRFRPIGLGYSNLGSLIMTGGLAYDSDEARGLCGTITALLHGAAYLASTELAAAVGTFDDFEKNREPMLHVMEMHWEKVDQIKTCPKYLQEAARDLWDKVLAHGRRHGFRNAQATVLAPTGTISFMMDCDTTGIEPDIALVKYKQLAGGGMLKIVNQEVPLALQTLGYDEPEVEAIVDYIDKHDTIEGAAELKPEHLSVFDCAFPPRNGKRSIPWRAHIQMMAAAQPFVSGAISKTVNMPRESTVEDVADAYMEGWRLGLKALAIYRDGSKEVQPLSTKTKSDKSAAEKVVAAPRRERLPDTRQSVTHKFSVSGHEGYITVGLYPDGRPGELFITMAKEGSTIGGLMDCFGTAVSMSLQYGVPLEVYVNKFSHTRFEPMGFTKNNDIKIAKSIVDYIFRWLGITFLPGFREANKMVPPSPVEQPHPPESGDADAERRPAATTAGGPNAAHGSASSGSNGSRNAAGSILNTTPKPNGNGKSGANGSGNGHSALKPAAKRTASPADAGGPAFLPASQPATGGQTFLSASKPVTVGQPSGTGGQTFLSASKLLDAGASPLSRSEQFASFQTDAPACDSCGAITVRNGNCYLCYNCGTSMGCS
jgi:ribonucleoside-diphosphate reductase alpha chain